MIAKIKTGSFTKGLIQYHNKKEETGKAEIFHSTLDNFKSLKPESIERIFRSFTFNSKRKDINFHVSLNFTEEDFSKLDEEKRKKIVERYMSGIGFPEDHPFVAYRHSDKKHPHLHVICPKIMENGKALNDSNLFQRNRKLAREIEKEFGLSNAEGRGVKKKTEAGENLIELLRRYEQKEIPLNEYLRIAAVAVLDMEKPVSVEGFRQKLSEKGIYLYQTGHKNPGLIYTVKQNTPEIKAKDTGIKSWDLDKNRLSYAKLNKEFERNREGHKKHVQHSVDYILKKYDSLTFGTFCKELEKREVVVKINGSKDEIKGISFEYKGNTYKGQDLPGREYTWGKLKGRFSEKDAISEKFITEIKLKTSGIDKMKSLDKMTKAAIQEGLFVVLTGEGIHFHNVYGGQLSESYVTKDNFASALAKMTDGQIRSLNESFLKGFTDEMSRGEKQVPEHIGELSEIFDELFEDLQESSDVSDEEPVKGKKRKRPRL